MKGRLWQCDRQWRRLHSQCVEFNKWPQVMGAFYFKSDGAGQRFQNTAMVQVAAPFGDGMRFETKGARYELEKL